MVRIVSVEPLTGYSLRLTLTDGSVIERDIEHLLTGKLLRPIHDDLDLFQSAIASDGTIAWPNGADLCPDVVIWGGAPPKEANIPKETSLAVPV